MQSSFDIYRPRCYSRFSRTRAGILVFILCYTLLPVVGINPRAGILVRCITLRVLSVSILAQHFVVYRGTICLRVIAISVALRLGNLCHVSILMAFGFAV
ncbi:hypothetical protein GGR57DRAFT_452721 [Xylariaceae sp. FL1272]|nr:hypothetical protein GGR57DRAFT_452721 [Xylariaceae sp. FL1272]